MRNNQIKTCSAYPPGSYDILPILFWWLLLSGLVFALSGCGDSPQAGAVQGDSSDNNGVYKGPGPNDPDVQAFKVSFWDPLRAANNCVECHDSGQTPMFVNSVNINDAYDNAKTVVDVLNPANSRIVDKVGRGHHCWLGNNYRGCADIIQRYITNWLGASSDSGRSIVLTAPPLVDPGTGKNFPATAETGSPYSFRETVYPLLNDNCSACHSSSAAPATRQAPFFADDDWYAAYEAAKAKMDLNEGISASDKSRFVLRLRNEFHNCWSTVAQGGCDADASELRAAIIAFAGGIPQPTPIGSSFVVSKAMTLQVPPAIIASGGSRYEQNMIALWEFKEGTGTTIVDATGDGFGPAINLTLSGEDPNNSSVKYYQWVNGYGIEFMPCPMGSMSCGKAQSAGDTSKLNVIKQTGEYAIEAWVVPGNVTQEGKSIISYSNGAVERNFTMAQTMYNYDYINHTNIADGTANSKLSTDPDDEDLQASLQHVVMNFDPVNGRQIFVNGVSTGDSDISGQKGGSVSVWQNLPLVFGAEQDASFATSWTGKLRMVAIHKRALKPEQIRQNYAASVGQKYLLLFSIGAHLSVADSDSYIMFEVEQYDNYAYLFSTPKFINLNPGWTPSADITIKGIRIGVNGKEAVGGQAFSYLDATVTSAQYNAADGQLLSGIGTIISASSANDEFFLTFEELNGATHDYSESDPVAPLAPADAVMISKIGVRTFDEINATMSAVTGVSVTNTSVKSTFDQYRRQLPAVEDAQAYLSSHQMAVAQLAMKYCDVLVDTNPGYFVPFNFSQVPSVAFATGSTTGRNNVLNPLLKAIMNVDVPSSKNLGSQPVEADIRAMLSSDTPVVLGDGSTDTFESLIDCMTRCERTLPECAIYVGTTDTNGTSCVGEVQDTMARTKEVVKASCAAMLGSAVMLIQ